MGYTEFPSEMNKVSAYLLAFVLWMLLHLHYIVHNFFYMCKYDFFPALYELSVSIFCVRCRIGTRWDGEECLSGDVQRWKRTYWMQNLRMV